MLIYNNLVINLNSKRYKPFLLNLVSGRRRLLNDSEFEIVKGIACNEDYDEKSEEFVNRLIQEKQFLTNEQLEKIESSLECSGYWEKETDVAEDYRFSIELTRDCNMNCPFCYAKERTYASAMTKEKIDAIYAFYEKYSDDRQKIDDVPYIRITGGEPLVDEATASLIPYIVDKWKKARICLFTNGINLIKYYNYLPLERIEEVAVSLDGIAEVHLKHRYKDRVPSTDVFDNIIQGIKRLLADNVKVRITTVLDKSNYKYYGELRNYLIEQSVLNNPNCSHLVNTELNFRDDPDMDSIKETEEMNSELSEYGVELIANHSMMKLRNIALRGYNEPYLPKCKRCRRENLANYFFACDGRVYHCDCLEDSIGSVGTFFPQAEIFEDVIMQISESTILKQEECRKCSYKYVCLGGCALVARAKGKVMDCGIFAHEDILDNLEFDYAKIARIGEENNAAY